MQNAEGRRQKAEGGRRAQGADRKPALRLRPASCALRPAFTLVELLVVIAILSVVTVASIPFIIPALSSRAVREAARIVNTQFAAAQAQAMATGRPAGVWLERLSGDAAGSIDMYLAEVPTPYAGQNVNETVLVQIPTVYSTNGTVTFSNAGFYPLVRPGDLIRFNNSGPYYALSDVPPAVSIADPNDPSARVLTNVATSPGEWQKQISILPTDTHFRCAPSAYAPSAAPPPGWGWTTTFQVFRQPVKSAGTPVQLPTGAVIDLIDSGVGNQLLYQLMPENVLTTNPATNPPSHSQFNDDQRLDLFTSDPAGAGKPSRPIVFLFNSSGALDSVCFNLTNPSAWTAPPQTTATIGLSSPVYLMIGKREKVFQKDASSGKYDPLYYNTGDSASTEAEKHNFRDLENLWLAINPQSGLVSTAEVADIVDSTIAGTTTHEVLQNAVFGSRAFAQSAQATGGR